MAIHVLGIRHHGPGSSKHVLQALAQLQPDIILIEGPPEGDSMLKWCREADMKPPVAMLSYVPDNPQHAVFYPFTSYSPEWQGIQYGIQHNIPTRFMDMPLVHKMGIQAETEAQVIADDEEETSKQDTVEEALEEHPVEAIIKNPLSYLAEIAGFEDSEEWWEHQFELGNHPIEVFEAIGLAMSSLREELSAETPWREQVREAFMRKAIHQAKREKFERIVVICGAWHVSALQQMPKQKEDNLLLKNLPKVKVESTWIPWTNDRLSLNSGYGAGVHSPGWYQHYWEHPQDDGTRWLSRVAHIFRKNQIDISSAHIIEAVRLTHALTALRGRSHAGLHEYNEATQTIMCMGERALMDMVWEELIVGNDMGEVPEGVPQIPMQCDLEQQRKSLRLKMSNEMKELTLDLRNEKDLQKSVLFHRLLVLDIPWARNSYARGKGTFKESWQLKWTPELTIALLEKAPWGNTIELASNQFLIHQSSTATQLDDITALVQLALPAELQEGMRAVMQRMDALASDTTDTVILMDALLPLIQIKKYGNVRKNDLEIIALLLESIFYRILVGLPISCTGIDEEQGSALATKIKQLHQGVLLLDEDDYRYAWTETIVKTLQLEMASAIVKGTCCKLLYDLHHFDAEQLATAFSKALSASINPVIAAAWLEGFLKDSASILVLDDTIWGIIYDWSVQLHQNIFIEVLPLLRRSFADYSPAEKQKLAQKAKQGKVNFSKKQVVMLLDHERAASVLPSLKLVMGLVDQ